MLYTISFSAQSDSIFIGFTNLNPLVFLVPLVKTLTPINQQKPICTASSFFPILLSKIKIIEQLLAIHTRNPFFKQI